MDGEVRDLLDEIGRVRKQTRRLVERAGATGVKWTPPVPETNSIAVIVTHMCGSERQWIHAYVGGERFKRDRSSEFSQPADTVKSLLELIDRTGDSTAAVLEKETSESLDRAVKTGSPALADTARDCVLHSLSHQSVHVGHLEMTLQMWEHRNN